MSTPLQFFNAFREKLEQRGIHFVITSGMACMEYGVQQLTKDSDWIVAPADIEKLREFLFEQERDVPPWRISYRVIFGAPMEASYLGHGWTTHIAIWDSGTSPEHHLDFFGKPPRVKEQQASGWATRDTVARMKKTDRPKDWPILNALAKQSAEREDWNAILHLVAPPALTEFWARIPTEEKPRLECARPLLRTLPEKSSMELERLIAVETAIWQMVNRERHAVYQANWKRFYRRWTQEEKWVWPVNEPFWAQHQRVCKAAAQYELSKNPWEATAREEVFRKGLERARTVMRAEEDELRAVAPPIDEVLP